MIAMWPRLAVLATCALVGAVLPVGASATTAGGVVITGPAGAVAHVTLRSFLPLAPGQASIDILGASAGDVAGAALIGADGWGVKVSTLNGGCRYGGTCSTLPDGTTFGTDVDSTNANSTVRGLKAGAYSLVLLGRPGAKVSLRLRNGLASQQLRFNSAAHLQVTELTQQYPSAPDEMPEAYFDQQLTGLAGRNVTVLVAHLQAGRPKTLHFSGCLHHGVVPTVQIPQYGSACTGDSGAEGPGSTTGAVGVGGQDCTTVALPACVPLTTGSFHLSYALAQVFSSPVHVSLTADFLALQSGASASALTFTL